MAGVRREQPKVNGIMHGGNGQTTRVRRGATACRAANTPARGHRRKLQTAAWAGLQRRPRMEEGNYKRHTRMEETREGS